MTYFNENVKIEYKEDIPRKASDFKAEIVSFLNTDPDGIIYLGISDSDHKIDYANQGEDFKKRQMWESTISNWFSEGFAPNVIGLIQVKPNDDIFTVIVNSWPEKPYYFNKGKRRI